MLHHRTTTVAERAVDIADKAADRVWNQNHDWDLYVQCWLQIYEAALQELAGLPY